MATYVNISIHAERVCALVMLGDWLAPHSCDPACQIVCGGERLCNGIAWDPTAALSKAVKSTVTVPAGTASAPAAGDGRPSGLGCSVHWRSLSQRSVHAVAPELSRRRAQLALAQQRVPRRHACILECLPLPPSALHALHNVHKLRVPLKMLSLQCLLQGATIAEAYTHS